MERDTVSMGHKPYGLRETVRKGGGVVKEHYIKGRVNIFISNEGGSALPYRA